MVLVCEGLTKGCSRINTAVCCCRQLKCLGKRLHSLAASCRPMQQHPLPSQTLLLPHSNSMLTTLRLCLLSFLCSLVPPGYYIQSLDGGATGQLAKCPNNVTKDSSTPAGGYFRSNWVPPSAAIDTDGTTACTPCGLGILSRPTSQDERTDLQGLPQSSASPDPANPDLGNQDPAATDPASQDPANADAVSQDPYFGLVASSPFSCCK
jgi:hypothetical protein